ncbi:hypothetical protein Tco_1555450 [Tanacetum coccineum]
MLQPPEEHNSENVDTIIESPSPYPIPVEDSDSHMEEIDLFLAFDDSMPPGIENDDYDSEGDICFLEELLSNDPLPLLEIESSNLDHFNDPLSPRPPPEPPDVEICLNEDECFDPGEVRLMFLKMLKMTITFPSHLSFGFFYRISPTLRFLLYFSPPGVKTPFLTLAYPLRAGGISSGWNFHITSLFWQELLRLWDRVDKVILISEMDSQNKSGSRANDRQKSYANIRGKPMVFQVGDRVMLKVSLGNGVEHLEKGKLTQCMWSFKVIERVGKVAYNLNYNKIKPSYNTLRVKSWKSVWSMNHCDSIEWNTVLMTTLHFGGKSREVMDLEFKQ